MYHLNKGGEGRNRFLKWHFQGSRIGVWAHLLHSLMVLHHCIFSAVLQRFHPFYEIFAALSWSCFLFCFARQIFFNNYCQNITRSQEIRGCQLQTELEAFIFLFGLWLAEAPVCAQLGCDWQLREVCGGTLLSGWQDDFVEGNGERWHNVDLFTSRDGGGERPPPVLSHHSSCFPKRIYITRKDEQWKHRSSIRHKCPVTKVSFSCLLTKVKCRSCYETVAQLAKVIHVSTGHGMMSAAPTSYSGPKEKRRHGKNMSTFACEWAVGNKTGYSFMIRWERVSSHVCSIPTRWIKYDLSLALILTTAYI